MFPYLRAIEVNHGQVHIINASAFDISNSPCIRKSNEQRELEKNTTMNIMGEIMLINIEYDK